VSLIYVFSYKNTSSNFFWRDLALIKEEMTENTMLDTSLHWNVPYEIIRDNPQESYDGFRFLSERLRNGIDTLLPAGRFGAHHGLLKKEEILYEISSAPWTEMTGRIPWGIMPFFPDLKRSFTTNIYKDDRERTWILPESGKIRKNIDYVTVCGQSEEQQYPMLTMGTELSYAKKNEIPGLIRNFRNIVILVERCEQNDREILFKELSFLSRNIGTENLRDIKKVTRKHQTKQREGNSEIVLSHVNIIKAASLRYLGLSIHQDRILKNLSPFAENFTLDFLIPNRELASCMHGNTSLDGADFSINFTDGLLEGDIDTNRKEKKPLLKSWMEDKNGQDVPFDLISSFSSQGNRFWGLRQIVSIDYKERPGEMTVDYMFMETSPYLFVKGYITYPKTEESFKNVSPFSWPVFRLKRREKLKITGHYQDNNTWSATLQGQDTGQYFFHGNTFTLENSNKSYTISFQQFKRDIIGQLPVKLVKKGRHTLVYLCPGARIDNGKLPEKDYFQFFLYKGKRDQSLPDPGYLSSKIIQGDES